MVTYLKNHVVTAFGSTPLTRISRPDVQTWVRLLSEDKRLAPRTVRECYRILGSIMREAVDSRLIAESPCYRITLPRVENSEKRFLSAEEVARLADAFDSRYTALVFTAAHTGMRWGELAGLKHEHLNLL